MFDRLPPLYAIVDASLAARVGWTVPDLASAYLDGGARVVQLRGRAVSTGRLQGWCDAVVKRAASYDALVIVNDRADVAAMSGASGVHVGQDDVPVEDARRILGADAIVGLSTHTPAQLDDAATRPVSYVAVGPIHATRTKVTGYQPVGLSLVQHGARRRPSRPVVAIGGITLGNAAEALAAGATAVAVIEDLLTDGDPVARVRAYVDALEK